MRRRIFLPYLQVRLDINALQTVHHGRVELTRGTVVLRRITRCHNNPTLRQLMHAKRFVLQKLKHGGGKRLRDAINFIQEQYSLMNACFFLHAIHRCNNLAHGVFANAVMMTVEILLGNERQAQRALTRVVRNGVTHEVDTRLARNLRHYGGFTHTRRSEHHNRSLHMKRDARQSMVVFRQISADSAPDLLSCLLDVHVVSFPLPAHRRQAPPAPPTTARFRDDNLHRRTQTQRDNRACSLDTSPNHR